MFFVSCEVRPLAANDRFEDVGGAYVNCLINAGTAEEALDRAQTHLVTARAQSGAFAKQAGPGDGAATKSGQRGDSRDLQPRELVEELRFLRRRVD